MLFGLVQLTAGLRLTAVLVKDTLGTAASGRDNAEGTPRLWLTEPSPPPTPTRTELGWWTRPADTLHLCYVVLCVQVPELCPRVVVVLKRALYDNDDEVGVGFWHGVRCEPDGFGGREVCSCSYLKPWMVAAALYDNDDEVGCLFLAGEV